jgi:hypothetical protein
MVFSSVSMAGMAEVLGGDAGADHAVGDVGLGGFGGDFVPLP